MNSLRLAMLISSILGAAAIFHLSACDRKQEPAPAAADHSKQAAGASDGHDHSADSGAAHDHDDHDHGHGHGGPTINLGATTIGGFEVKATRDEGKIEPGKDAPIDGTATPAPGSTGKISVVRLWIGTQDAKGSVKAKADIEDPKEPNRWHTHVEIPNPLPAGSKLWAEIETDKGEKTAGSFDLKQ